MTAHFGERDGSGSTGPQPVRATLSPREREVLSLVVDRYRNPDIAARLHISKRTVESHIAALLRKLGAANRSELIAAGGPAAAPRDVSGEVAGEVASEVAGEVAADVASAPISGVLSGAARLRGQSSVSRAQARRHRISAAREVTWARALCAKAERLLAQSGHRSPMAADRDEG